MHWSVLTWILTYALHSTVLICAVWLLTSAVSRWSLPTREVLWRVALLGGILTASLQVGVGVIPAWGGFSLPVGASIEQSVEPAPVSPQFPSERIVHEAGELTITTVREARLPVASAPEAPGQPEEPLWPWAVLVAVALGSVFALGRLLLIGLQLRKQLKGRRDVIEDPLLENFLALCQKAELGRRIRLSASPKLRSPVALWRAEICLPERAVDSLTVGQQKGMLAHELGHLVRRDPQWTIFVAFVEAILFFQPLNHLVRRKLQELAEYQCDDWAVGHTGEGVHLAKCLAEVASWVEGVEAPHPLVVPMASNASPIVRRITRLLNDRGARDRDVGAHYVASVFTSLALLGLVAWLVPGVTHARDRRPTTSGAPPLATSLLDGPDGVSFEERSDAAHERAELRIKTDTEIVRVEVERNKPQVLEIEHHVESRREPPSRDSFRIILRGGVKVRPFELFEDGGWDMWLDFKAGEQVGELDALDAILRERDPFGGTVLFPDVVPGPADRVGHDDCDKDDWPGPCESERVSQPPPTSKVIHL